MPDLQTSTLIWLAGIALAAIVWMIFVSPRLVPKLAQGIHQVDEGELKVSIIDRMTLYLASILMFFVAFIVAIMFFEVVMRYVFSSPTIWVEELSRWMGGMVFLLSGLYAMQQRSHIRVVLVYDIVSRPMQRVFDVITTVCILVFCYAVATGYAKNAWTKFSTWELYGSAWNPPIPAIMKPLIVLTCVWMAIQAINNLICDWSKPKEVHGPIDEI
jgi:TRAP-type C4-dicarboxylate transport system permease small subunit